MAQKFSKDQVIVSVREQQTDCGLTIVHEGSIVIVADEGKKYTEWFEVYKSLDRKKSDRRTDVKASFFRPAKEHEQDAFFRNVRNISEI